ncbi:hypothetical protein [Cetobacterium somerae]|nr:hypothetical protein [Cetobacterium somerae]
MRELKKNIKKRDEERNEKNVNKLRKEGKNKYMENYEDVKRW